MALQNGANTGAPTAKHKRAQSSRVIPVIPRQLARAPTVKKSSEVTAEQPVQEKSKQDGAEITAHMSAVNGSQETTEAVTDASPALHVPVNGISASKDVGETVLSNGSEPDKAPAIEHGSTTPETLVTEPQAVPDPVETHIDAEDTAAPQQVTAETPRAAAQPAQLSGQRRTEFPPPFVPSARLSGSGTEAQPSVHAITGTGPSRPFVFGATSDTYSFNHSPTPPASAGSGVSSSAPSQVLNGSVHHTSQAMTGSGQPFSGPQAPSFSPYDAQQNFYNIPPQHPQWVPASNQANPVSYGSQPFAASMQSEHSQTPRSGSQTSLPLNEPQSQTHAYHRPQHSHTHNSSVQHVYPYQHTPPHVHPGRHLEHRGARPENNLFMVQSYLDEQIGQAEFADCLVQFDDTSKPLFCHALMLARNPKLRSMLRSSAVSSEDDYLGKAYRRLEIPQNFYFKSSTGFVEAVRYIYGGQTLNERVLVLPFLSSPEALVSSVLSYAAAACSLEIPDAAVAALTVVSYRLSWTTLETALEFALHGGIGSKWRRYSTTVIDGGKPEDMKTGPTYGPYASDVLEMVVRFICWNFVADFSFDRSASQLPNIKRFPEILVGTSATVVHGPRSPVSDQRLRGIRLGSFQAQSTTSSTLSSILLSVPLPVVQAVFDDLQMQDRVNPMILESYIRGVVEEREKRRQTALQAFNADSGLVNGEAHSSGLQQVLHAQEEFQHLEQGMPRFRIISHSDLANGQ